MHVIIIGAGTGGLCLAQALKRDGITVEVYERDRTRTDGLFGYRVGVSPEGSRALADCLPADLFETFKATTAITPRYFNILTEKYAEVLSLDGFDEVKPDDPAAERSVSRMTLRQVLLTGLETDVHFDKTFSRYQQHDDGTVTAFFEDGSTATGDLLVGADGTWSGVRRQYLPDAQLKETDLFGITAKLPLTDDTRKLLTSKVLRGVSMVTAPQGYSAIIHVMEFPWDHNGAVKIGVGGNDADLLNAWPGLNFDNTRDYIMLGFGGHQRYLPENLMDLDGAALHKVMLDRTATWHPNLRKLFELADPTTCFPINIRTSTRVDPWPTSNVTLIGDAIHTMTPGLGVGANTALRDAQNLSRDLAAAANGEMTVLEAVADYEKQMNAYAWDAVEKSRERFSGDAVSFKPGIGRLALALSRTGMRLVNNLPPVKKKIKASMSAERSHNHNE